MASGSRTKWSKKLADPKVRVASREEQWNDHNLNSTSRTDLNREERKKRQVERLRSWGVKEDELTLVHEVPEDKLDQGGVIDLLNLQSAGVITTWSGERRNYYEILIYGKGTSQAKGDMRAIRNMIQDHLKPELEWLNKRVKEEGGRAVYPPYCFDTEVDDLKVPIPPKGKGKGMRK